MNNKQQGMTLIELMVTLAVVAILASVAAPSLSTMLENNRLTALNNQIVSSINYTRGEAVKRRYNTVMCVRNSIGSNCDDIDGTGGTLNFSSGWLVFVDCNGNKMIDAGNTCDLDGNGSVDVPEMILQDTLPSATNVTITTSAVGTPRRITYRPNGSALEGRTLTLNVGSTRKYEVKVATNTGRVSSCKVGNPGCP